MSASIGDAGFFRARVSHTSRRRVHVEAQPLAILPLHATLTACPQREVRCFGSPYENDHYPIQKKYIRTLDYIFLVIYLLVGVAFYVRHRTKISYTVTDTASYLFICLAGHRNILSLRHNRREKFDDTGGPDFSSNNPDTKYCCLAPKTPRDGTNARSADRLRLGQRKVENSATT